MGAPDMNAVTYRRARGFMLIEALVALLLFSLGVLGMVALQARASQESLSSEYRARAALLANELSAAMWQQLSTTLASDTVSSWQEQVTAGELSGGLPNGKGDVSVDSDGVATITVTWKPVAARTGDSSNQYVTKVVLP